MVIKTDHMAYLCSLGEASSVADNPYSWAHRRIRELEAELAEARLDGARLQTALKAAMVVLSGQETSKAMLIRALELGRLAMKEAQ